MDEYLNDTLKAYVVPEFQAFQAQGDHTTFLEDNAGAHGTRTHWNPCAQLKKDMGIKCLQLWPPLSPDFSPTENVWRILKQRVKLHKATTKEALRAAIEEEWEKITFEEINRCMLSLPARMKETVDRKGYQTSYELILWFRLACVRIYLTATSMFLDTGQPLISSNPSRNGTSLPYGRPETLRRLSRKESSTYCSDSLHATLRPLSSSHPFFLSIA